MHIAYLARAENEMFASSLEDELRFVFREHVRGAVVLLRQLFLPLHHFAGEANDHVVLIGLSVDRDGTECGASDLHGLILFLDSASVSKRTKAVPSRYKYLTRIPIDGPCATRMPTHRNQSIGNAPALNNGAPKTTARPTQLPPSI